MKMRFDGTGEKEKNINGNLKDKLERQEAVLADIKSQTKVQGYLQARTQNTVQSEYKKEIEMRVEASMDIEYLRAVYTFAKHYPNKSIVA